jgi:hypothetical protein
MNQNQLRSRRWITRFKPSVFAAFVAWAPAFATAKAGEYERAADVSGLDGSVDCGGAGVHAAGLAAAGCARINGYIAAGADLNNDRIGGLRGAFGPVAAPGIVSGLGSPPQPAEGQPGLNHFFLPAGDGDIAR